jgi:hypothetical protein
LRYPGFERFGGASFDVDKARNGRWYETSLKEAEFMSKRQKQTAFLRTLVLHGDAGARRQLLEKMSKAERDEHCSWCALWLVIILSLLSVCGLCYSSVLVPDFFQNPAQLVVKIFCVFGIASLACSVVFMSCWLWYRGALNRLHEESRRFIMDILESQSTRNQRASPVASSGTTKLNGNHGTASPAAPVQYVSYWELFSTRKAS